MAASCAWYKLVATSVPISERNKDSWGGFQAQRTEILDYIASKEIRGVTSLAADVHFAAALTIDDRLALREFIVGLLAAPSNSLYPKRGYEFFYNHSFNYDMVRVHASMRPPYAELVLVDKNNKVLYKTTIEDPR